MLAEPRTLLHYPCRIEHDDHFESGVALKIAAVATNEPEAAMICGLLADAGLRSMTKPGSGGIGLGWNASYRRSIYVRDDDLVRAREVVKVVGQGTDNADD